MSDRTPEPRCDRCDHLLTDHVSLGWNQYTAGLAVHVGECDQCSPGWCETFLDSGAA